MARKKRVVKESFTTGYIVEGFDTVSNGYGNLTGKKMTPCQAIKFFCLECQGGHEMDWRCSDGSVTKATRPTEDVRSCSSKTCWLFPFKMGRSPNRAHVKGSFTSSTSASARARRGKTATK